MCIIGATCHYPRHRLIEDMLQPGPIEPNEFQAAAGAMPPSQPSLCIPMDVTEDGDFDRQGPGRSPIAGSILRTFSAGRGPPIWSLGGAAGVTIAPAGSAWGTAIQDSLDLIRPLLGHDGLTAWSTWSKHRYAPLDRCQFR